MSKEEFLEYVEEENIDLERYNFIIGRKINIPFATGCFFKDGQWSVYGVDEKQHLTVIKEGDEDTIFTYMFVLLRGAIKA